MSEIKHEWNGTVLTVISDSGASSADLKGEKGDTGPRGPQGPGGVIYSENGEVILDLGDYYSKGEVDDLLKDVGTADDSATREYVDQQTAVDGITIIRNSSGQLASAIGGMVRHNLFSGVGIDLTQADGDVGYATNGTIVANQVYNFEANVVGMGIVGGTCEFTGSGTLTSSVTIGESKVNLVLLPTGKLFVSVRGDITLSDFFVWTEVPKQLDASLIPVDGETLVIRDGKLCVVGGASLPSSEEVSY